MPVATRTNKAISSWSGGKDSCFACYKAMKEGYDIKHLLSFVTRETKRGCFHGIEAELLKLQASTIGIPIVLEEVSPDMQKYEEEFKAAVNRIRGTEINSMIFGDIYLLDHQSWVERVCSEIKIKPVEPLWNIGTEEILREFIALGFKSVIISCKDDCMGKGFLGREIDLGLIEELKKRGICPCGENGEYHTIVVDGPIFKRPIKIKESQPLFKDGFWKHWFLDIKKFE